MIPPTIPRLISSAGVSRSQAVTRGMSSAPSLRIEVASYAGRLVGRGAGGAGGVDQREDRRPETGGQPEQPGRGPAPGRGDPLAGLRGIRDRGALVAAETAAQAAIHAFA